MEASPKRDRWTEADVAELPAGEHDYFERKSGRLFDGDRGELLGTTAKALSAFSNSGGGHLVLGVADDGSFDGVPPAIKGRTSTREWLEQKVPNLLAYALSDFRVHLVERGNHGSLIPADRDPWKHQNRAGVHVAAVVAHSRPQAPSRWWSVPRARCGG